MSTTRDQIITACKAIEPDPEHGPDQYGVVIDHINEEGDYGNLFDLSNRDAVELVLSFMNMSLGSGP